MNSAHVSAGCYKLQKVEQVVNATSFSLSPKETSHPYLSIFPCDTISRLFTACGRPDLYQYLYNLKSPNSCELSLHVQTKQPCNKMFDLFLFEVSAWSSLSGLTLAAYHPEKQNLFWALCLSYVRPIAWWTVLAVFVGHQSEIKEQTARTDTGRRQEVWPPFLLRPWRFLRHSFTSAVPDNTCTRFPLHVYFSDRAPCLSVDWYFYCCWPLEICFSDRCICYLFKSFAPTLRLSPIHHRWRDWERSPWLRSHSKIYCLKYFDFHLSFKVWFEVTVTVVITML